MKKELQILIIEDVSADVVLINHELRKGGFSFRSKRVETRDDFVREVQQNRPDLILSDHGLPQFDGFAALALAKQHCPDIPFLFVTGSMGEEVAIESLKSGALDYVLKGRMHLLVPAVTRALHLANERQKRVAAEAALAESENRFRLLVNGVREYAIFMLDARGRVTTWNSGSEVIYAYRAEEIIGRDFACMFTAEDIERGRPQELLRVATTEGRSERQGRRVRKGGSRFWAETVISALRDAKGLRGYVAVTRDISQQKRLAAEPARLSAIVGGSDDAIIGKTLQGTITSWNAGAERLFGYSAEEALGQPMLMLFPPEARSEEPAILDRIARGESVRQFDTMRVRKDGSRVDVSIIISPIRDGNGQIVGASIIARDIMEQKRAAEELRRSEGRRAAILDATLDAIVLVDGNGRIHEWNDAAVRMFGYSRDAAVAGRMDDLIIAPSVLAQYEGGLAQYLMTGAGSLIGRPIAMAARRADGTEFPVEVGITSIPQTGPPHYTLVIRDITARQQAEAEVRRLNAELERRVRERTAELQAANEELESFSYSVSHDLRAPVRHIAGFADILRQNTPPLPEAEGRRLVQNIADSAARMSRLIDALLDFSRLGRAELRKTRVSLAGLVQSARSELEAESRSRRVEWVVGPLPDVEADPTLLRQVLINLLGNALKYTRPRDPARIEIGARTEPTETTCFVRDNGVGFDMRFSEKLFGVFQRLHRPSEFEGTGIGLATARLIIHRHGGRTWAESELGTGATFHFSLPASAGGPAEHE